MAYCLLYAGQTRFMALTSKKIAGCLNSKIEPKGQCKKSWKAFTAVFSIANINGTDSDLPPHNLNLWRRLIQRQPDKTLEKECGFSSTIIRLPEVLEESGVLVSYMITESSPSHQKCQPQIWKIFADRVSADELRERHTRFVKDHLLQRRTRHNE